MKDHVPAQNRTHSPSDADSAHVDVGTAEGAREAPGFEGLFDRLWGRTNVDTQSGCWRLIGVPTRKGYGRVRWFGKQVQVHRLAHEAFIGPIPEGYVVDHVRASGCVHRDCWNPAHLEAVTTDENNRRIPNWVRQHCPRGHEMTEENTVTQIVPKGYTNRMCRECRRASGRASARRRALAKKGAVA